MSDFNTSAEARTHPTVSAPDDSSTHGRITRHRVLRALAIPAGEAGQLANPPPLPPGEIQPDDFLKLNDESMTPPSHGATDHP
jgi:hypothetical protein